MTYLSKDLSVLAYANGFTLWHYTTEDSNEDVEYTNYFTLAADMLRVGDIIVTNTSIEQKRPTSCMLLVNLNNKDVVEVHNMTTYTPKSME